MEVLMRGAVDLVNAREGTSAPRLPVALHLTGIGLRLDFGP